MKRLAAAIVLTALVSALGLALLAQPPAPGPMERPFKIIRLDRAPDEIISPNAKLETLGEHFGLTEGPVWIQNSQGAISSSATAPRTSSTSGRPREGLPAICPCISNAAATRETMR